MARRRNSYIFAPEPKKKRGPGCLLLALVLLGALLALTALVNLSQNSRLTLKTQKVAALNLSTAFERFTVLHLSDLHASPLGEDKAAWREALNGKRFDCVVMTGDMVGSTGNVGPMLSLIETLREINSTAPIFFVAGDDDPPAIDGRLTDSAEPVAAWVTAAQKAGAVWLDSPQSVDAGKRKVWLLPEYLYEMDAQETLDILTRQQQEMEQRGAPYEAEGGAQYRALLRRLEAAQRCVDTLPLIDPRDLQIAVIHAPLDVDGVRRMLGWADTQQTVNFRAISLLLSGHYAGGQWRLPWGGAVYVPEKGAFVSDADIKGMQRINSINQHISGGLGPSEFYPALMRSRLFNPPEATLLVMTAKIE